MREGIQTNFKNDELRRGGCYFFVLCRMAELLREKLGQPGFSDDEIINFYLHCLKEKWVTTGIRNFNGVPRQVTCLIEDPIAILNYLQGYTIFKTFTHEQIRPNAEYYPVFFDGTPTHFALGSYGKIIWDSWLPSAKERGLKMALTNPYRWLR